MLQRFIIPTLCYVVICYRDKKPSLFLLNVDGRSHGHIFLFWNFNQSFIYHGRTLNLDKVFGWWSYFFDQTNAQISYYCFFFLSRMHYSFGTIIENSWVNYLFGCSELKLPRDLLNHSSKTIASILLHNAKWKLQV